MRPISTKWWLSSSIWLAITCAVWAQDIVIDTPGADARVTYPRIERRVQPAGQITRVRASVPTTWTVLQPADWKQVHAVSDTAVVFQMPAAPVWLLEGLGERAILVIITPGEGPAPIDPQPPTPTPPDPTPPAPQPTPTPLPGPGLKVAVIEEKADRPKLPAAQSRIFSSVPVRNYLNAHAPNRYRFFDKDDQLAADDPLAPALARPRKSLPWIVIGNETSGFEGPLPADEAALLELLQKFGGP